MSDHDGAGDGGSPSHKELHEYELRLGADTPGRPGYDRCWVPGVRRDHFISLLMAASVMADPDNRDKTVSPVSKNSAVVSLPKERGFAVRWIDGDNFVTEKRIKTTTPSEVVSAELRDGAAKTTRRFAYDGYTVHQ